MKIRTIQDVRALESAVDRCSRDVWLEGPNGEKYSLKSDLGRYIGIGKLLQDDTEELGLYAADRGDETILLDLVRKLSA